MPVLDASERAALNAADSELHGLQTALEAAVQNEALDTDSLDRLRQTAEQVIRRVNANLPPQIDAEARDEIRRRLVDVLTLGTDHGEPLDLADRALIEAEAVRHVMRDLLQEQPPAELRDPQSALELLQGWLPALPAADLAELAGLSTRQVQRIRRGTTAPSSSRLQLLTRLVAILRFAWTDAGVYAWFHRVRPELGGHTPLERLDDPGSERTLLIMARAGRVQGGS